jgi:hypothetical protein
MKQINEITFMSNDNMTFVHIEDLDTDLGNVIQIGTLPNTDIADSIDNYIEVEISRFKPMEETPSVDNLVLPYAMDSEDITIQDDK